MCGGDHHRTPVAGCGATRVVQRVDSGSDPAGEPALTPVGASGPPAGEKPHSQPSQSQEGRVPLFLPSQGNDDAGLPEMQTEANVEEKTLEGEWDDGVERSYTWDEPMFDENDDAAFAPEVDGTEFGATQFGNDKLRVCVCVMHFSWTACAPEFDRQSPWLCRLSDHSSKIDSCAQILGFVMCPAVKRNI